MKMTFTSKRYFVVVVVVFVALCIFFNNLPRLAYNYVEDDSTQSLKNIMHPSTSKQDKTMVKHGPENTFLITVKRDLENKFLNIHSPNNTTTGLSNKESYEAHSTNSLYNTTGISYSTDLENNTRSTPSQNNITGLSERERHETTQHIPRIIEKRNKLGDFLEVKKICQNQKAFNGAVINDTNLRPQYEHGCKELAKDKQEYFRLREDKVNPYQYSFLEAAPDKCDRDTEIIILVNSFYFNKRQSIRNTWGKEIKAGKWIGTKLSVKINLLFVLGMHRDKKKERLLQDEMKSNKDIIQGDFFEDYRNLTLKSLLGLKWVMNYCPQAKYLLKIDDDAFINIPLLTEVLHTTNMSHTIMGHRNGRSSVMRGHGKWGLTDDEYPFKLFPVYESGGAYVISDDLIQPLFEASEYVPLIFIDDVYITGILGQILQVTHQHVPGFAYVHKLNPKPCHVENEKIISFVFKRYSYQNTFWTDYVKSDCTKSFRQNA